MALLLFFKQIIDIFYDYKLLDYILVGIAAIIIINQLWMLRPDKEVSASKDEKAADNNRGKLLISLISHIRFPDLCIMAITFIILVHMIVDSNTSIFTCGKVVSAFMIYLVGRLCQKRITECTWALVAASYIVVYANLIARFLQKGANAFFEGGNSNGLLYFFDTDMAYAILLALVFVAMYAQNTIWKFLTIFAVCPFLIINSDADVQKLLLVVIYIILFLFMAERAVKKRRFTDFILPVAIIGLLIIIAALILPVFTGDDGQFFMKIIGKFIDTDNFATRYIIWTEQIADVKNAGLINQIFGLGVTGFSGTGNQYLAILTSTGIAGLLLLILFVCSISVYAVHIEDRKTYYVTVMLAIIFLGTCIVVNGMEFTQLSWFPMLYAGMVACGKRSVAGSNR